MYCKNCGNEILDDANFCSVCGTAIDKEYEIIKIENKASKILKNNSSKRIMSQWLSVIMLAMLILILILFILIIVAIKSNKEDSNNNILARNMEKEDEAEKFEGEEINAIMDSDDFSVNGNTEGNRNNGGWVAEQGDWNYYAISGRIYKENIVTGEKYGIFQAMSNDVHISMQVMGEWIYFRMSDNYLYRISVDGSRGQKYAPSLGNDLIIAWDVYDGNVYIIVRENLSASTYNYYFAITDWDTQTYKKIFDIGDMRSISGNYGMQGAFVHASSDSDDFFNYRDAQYFLGVDEGYAYFIYTAPESNRKRSSFTAYRINLDDLGDTTQINWVNDKRLPYGNIYVSNDCIYAFCYDLYYGSTEDSYYDIINFNDSTISTYWVPELAGVGSTTANVSPVGILYEDIEQFSYIVDDKVVKISEDSAHSICTAHNQVYYRSNNMYCRINLDGTGWESIDLNSFNWIDSTIVFE